mmetsp:Transcript_5502/g.10477  ORF Transcript_5502/g.10477 Transcript_5502/m.10477 type:complete len:273 (-) Transcript_5502:2436-3254(-)
MKFEILLLFALLSTVDAGVSYPTVSINLHGVHDGDDAAVGPFEGLEPIASWGASASALGFDFEAGATSSIKPTLDVLSLPKSIWGKMRRQAGGWTVSTKAVASLDGSNTVGLNVAADHDEWDTSIEISSTSNSSRGSQRVQVCKGFEVLGGRLSVNPRYNIQSSNGDVILGYDTGSTAVTIEASPSKQTLMLSQELPRGNLIAPSVTSNGDFAVAWKKSLPQGNSVTTTLKVNDSISVRWEDGPWTATMVSPMDGFKTGDINIKVNRKLNLV